MHNILMEIFQQLLRQYGPLHWWPAETPFEVCVGAILTQNTAWTNVEKAIAALREADLLAPERLLEAGPDRLAGLIRPAGYYNVKSERLLGFVRWLADRHGGSLDRMFSGDWQVLRRELLAVKGIGPETGDCILLYAGARPSFVVDAYTRRLFSRLGIIAGDESYDHIRRLFMDSLPPDPDLFNEYHALIVEQCKRHCRTKPACAGCPLAPCCSHCTDI